MADKVSFDGPNKLVIVENGITSLDFDADIYSAWKRWIQLSDNFKYLQAIRVVGGDPTVGLNALGSTFFFMNNWKLRPYEGNHELSINGNFYGEGGYNPLQPTIGSYNVLVTRQTSNLIDLITVSTGSALTPDQAAQLIQILNNTNLTKILSLGMS
jgi:hypothetical protein